MKSNWRKLKLGEVCVSKTGTRSPSDTPDSIFSYVDITSVDNVSKRIVAPKELIGRDAPSRARQIIRAGDVLVSTTRPNLNAVALVPPELDNQIASTGFCVLRGGDEIDSEFLFSFVRTPEFVSSLTELTKGALYPAVNDKQVFSQFISLPPKGEQRRIAARLREQMAEVERARAAVQAQLDAAQSLPAALLRAIFTSPAAQRWLRRKLEDVATLQRGRFSPRPRNNPIFFGGKFPFIQTGDVDLSDGYIREYKQTLNERGFAVSKMFPVGTLVISIAANIGGVGMLTFDSCMTDSLVGIQGKNGEADNRFLYFVLRHLRPYLQSIAPHMAQANLSIALLGPVEINLPPLAEQHKVAARLDAEFTAARSLCETLESRLAEIELLPATLLRSAFSQQN
jgi:type I restriction enzyme S subunit